MQMQKTSHEVVAILITGPKIKSWSIENKGYKYTQCILYICGSLQTKQEVGVHLENEKWIEYSSLPVKKEEVLFLKVAWSNTCDVFFQNRSLLGFSALFGLIWMVFYQSDKTALNYNIDLLNQIIIKI